MGMMTEYEKRMVELEKRKVKILTEIYKEIFYMNQPRPRYCREYSTMSEEDEDTEMKEAECEVDGKE